MNFYKVVIILGKEDFNNAWTFLFLRKRKSYNDKGI